MKEQPECIVNEYGTKEWLLHGKLHREDGPAYVHANGYKEWFLNDEIVHPETLVDLHLSRGTFCWWNEKEDKLEF